MERQQSLCAVCHEYYDPAASVGRWECRTHVVRERAYVSGKSIYPCCGLSDQDDFDAYSFFHTHISRKMLRGCVKADHIATTVAPKATISMRRVDDLHLLSDITQVGSLEFIPKEAIVTGPTALAFGHLGPRSKKMIVQMTVPSMPEDEGGILSKINVERDLRAAARMAIERAYAREEVYATDPARHLRENILLNRGTVTSATDPAAQAFIEKTRMLSNEQYLVKWFTERDTRKITINLCVVRAVAPTQDKVFLEALTSLRRYAASHNAMQ